MIVEGFEVYFMFQGHQSRHLPPCHLLSMLAYSQTQANSTFQLIKKCAKHLVEVVTFPNG